MKRKFITQPAALGCVVILALCAAGLFFKSAKDDGKNVSVFADGEYVCSLPLSTDTVYEIKEKQIKIEVKDGSAFISESRCKCKTCVSFGKLSKPGQTAVCLPERVIIKIDGQEELDAVL